MANSEHQGRAADLWEDFHSLALAATAKRASPRALPLAPLIFRLTLGRVDSPCRAAACGVLGTDAATLWGLGLLLSFYL